MMISSQTKQSIVPPNELHPLFLVFVFSMKHCQAFKLHTFGLWASSMGALCIQVLEFLSCSTFANVIELLHVITIGNLQLETYTMVE
jgi:hypothetical protein